MGLRTGRWTMQSKATGSHVAKTMAIGIGIHISIGTLDWFGLVW